MFVKPDSPFYKNPALWVVLLLPLSTVVVGVIFLVFSITHYDGPVDDDYYKDGKQISQSRQRDTFAREHGLTAQFEIKPAQNIMQIAINSEKQVTLADQLSFKFIHRTVANQDIELQLNVQKPGSYIAVLPDIPDGQWQLELGDENWRLKGQLDFPRQSTLMLEPK